MSDMATSQISSVIFDRWAVGPRQALSRSAGMAGPKGDARRGSVSTWCSPSFPTKVPGNQPFLWAPPLEVTGVASIPEASVELQSTSSLITLCLNGGVTEGHVSGLAFEKKPPCFQFELTWSLFLCGDEIY